MAIKKIVRTSPDPILVAERFDQAQGALAKIAHVNWLIDQVNAEASHNKKIAFITLTDAATITWDYSLSSNAQVTLTASRALGVPTNVANGEYGTLKIIQDGTGGHVLTLPAAWKVANGGTFTNTTTADAVDIISWVYDGTDFWVTHGPDFL